jgi:RNA polymerase sigma factor (sigma-70 family)
MTTAPLGAVIHYLRTAPATPDRGLTDAQLLGRFVASGDEAAFTSLVRRHGSMVLGVCRHVLRHQQDAEDAFQVTFLVLARHAAAVRKKEALAGWLHGVAYRTALQARRTAARRRHHEARAEAMTQTHPSGGATWSDIQPVLDEEVGRLPPVYRAPFVLCCLEGRSRLEAAAELGLKEGTVSSRLNRARKLLRERLSVRGISLATALAALALAREAAAAVPARLVRGTVRAALHYAADGTVAAASLSPNAVTLLEGVSRTMFLTRSRIATLLFVLVVGLNVGGAALLFWSPAAEPAAAAAPSDRDAPPAPTPTEEQTHMPVSGSVYGADGKPVAGAAVVVVARPRRQPRSGDELIDTRAALGEGKTDTDGHFHFPATRTSSARFWEVYLVAAAPGHAVGWCRLGPDADRPEATLRLPPEQVIRGRLVDLQGVPAAGVQVLIGSVGRAVNGTWDGVPVAVLPRQAPWPLPVTTDERGRFEVRGCNRDLGVWIRVHDDRFALESFELTTPGKPRPESVVHGYDAGGFPHTQKTGPDEKGQAQEPTFVLPPPQVVEGRIVCEDTGKPVAGASVQGVRTTADGRFRLPVGPTDAITLLVVAPEGAPYLSVFHRVEWPKGAVRQEVEVKLPRGVLVRGRVTEAGTGRPVAGASLQFRPRDTARPTLRNLLGGFNRLEVTRDDGTFAFALPPGSGHLLVQGPTPDYVHQEVESEVLSSGRRGGSRYYPDAAVPVDVPARGEPKPVAVTLRRGSTVRGRLLGPDGKPVARALLLCRLHVPIDLAWHFAAEARAGAFEVHGLDPEKAVPVYFLDPVRRCGAVVELSGKQAGQEVTVTLAPCGQATARYVDEHGKPLADYRAAPDLVVTPGRWSYAADDGKPGDPVADAESLTNLDRDNYWDRVKTDAQGRVTFPALIPGSTYRLARFDMDRWLPYKEFRVQSGETVDLGDVVIRQAQ